MVISPSRCFMRRKQLVGLSLSLSGCSVHMTPGIDWRKLLFFISLSPLFHLTLYFTRSFCCLSFSYFDCLSFFWNQSSLRSYWDRSCLDLHLGHLNLSLNFYWDQGNRSWRWGCSLTFGLVSLEPWVREQSRRSGGSWRFHTQVCTLRMQVWHVSQRDQMQYICYFYPFPLFCTERV